MRIRSIHWPVVTLGMLAVLAALPVWSGPGLVNTRGGGDSPFLFFRLHQLATNLHDGVFPARWMPDAAYGLGYPFFNYYAALPYYLGALFNLIGFDLLVSIKLVQTLGFGFAVWGMYRWAERHTPTRSAAWLIAVAYTFAPFHLINVYVRGDSLSEFYAFVFYPLILLSIDRVIESPRSFGQLALSYGGLIMTHNVSALIFSPFILLYAVTALFKSAVGNRKSVMVSLALGWIFAFALSAWFWLPALGEAPLAQLDNQTTGYFNYAEHFRAANLVQNSIGFDYSIGVDPQSSTPFAMGLLQAIGTGLGLIALIVTWRRARDRSFRVFVVVGLFVSTIMITPPSKLLWDTLPLLPLSQFPWRFLSIQALFAALTIGYLVSGIVHPAARIGLSIAVGLTLAAAVLLPLRPDYLPIRADEITPARLQLYEAFTGNIGTTIRAEYLPRPTVPRPYTGPQLIDPSAVPLQAIVSSGDAVMTQQARQAARQIWAARVESVRATLAVPLLYWPGWTATIDGQAASIGAAPDLGYIQIDVPQGTHQIVFELGRTPLRLTAELVSLAAASGLLIWGAKNVHRSGRRWRVFDREIVAVELVLAVGLAAAVYQSAYTVPERPQVLTMDFVDKPWLHHNPGGVDFGAMRVLTYTLTPTSMNGVQLGLHIEAAAPVTGTLALAAPSTHLVGGPRPLLEKSQVFQPGLNTVSLTVPWPLATGMYYVRVQAGERSEYLQPFWISGSRDDLARHSFGLLTPAIGLSGALAQHRSADQLELVLQWAIGSETAANYGLSLRLHDAAGKVWTSLDTQPGYGFQPTSAWRRGQRQEAYTLALPLDLPRDEIYALDVIVYRVASQQEVGRTTIDGLRVDANYAWRVIDPPRKVYGEPTVARRFEADFADQIRLVGYTLAQSATQLDLTLGWQALRNIERNYKVFVHLFEPVTETIVAQWDAMPRNNTYATSRWFENESILDPIVLPLTGVPPGSYRLAIGLYDAAGRLPVSGSGAEVANQRVVLDEEIEVR